MDAIGLRPIRACAREQPVHLFDVGRLRAEQGLETFRMRMKGMRRLYEREEGDLRSYHGYWLVLGPHRCCSSVRSPSSSIVCTFSGQCACPLRAILEAICRQMAAS